MNIEGRGAHIARPDRKWRSGHWKTFSGAMVMVAALALVWAILASFTVWQREHDLDKAMEELNELREEVRRLQESDVSSTYDELFDDYYEAEPNTAGEAPTLNDPIAVFEEELGILTGEE